MVTENEDITFQNKKVNQTLQEGIGQEKGILDTVGMVPNAIIRMVTKRLVMDIVTVGRKVL